MRGNNKRQAFASGLQEQKKGAFEGSIGSTARLIKLQVSLLFCCLAYGGCFSSPVIYMHLSNVDVVLLAATMSFSIRIVANFIGLAK